MHKKSHLHVWPCCGTQITLQGKCKATISTGTAVTFLSLTNSYCMEVFVCKISLLLTIPKLVGACWKHPKKSSLRLHTILNFVVFSNPLHPVWCLPCFFQSFPSRKSIHPAWWSTSYSKTSNSKISWVDCWPIMTHPHFIQTAHLKRVVFKLQPVPMGFCPQNKRPDSFFDVPVPIIWPDGRWKMNNQ